VPGPRRPPNEPTKPDVAEEPSPGLLRKLKISPEVGYYLTSRGIALPTCPPRFKTPEPRTVTGARFDSERIDQVLRAFSLLRHTQGRWAGKPLVPDGWQVAYILAPTFGWVRLDEDTGRWVRVINSLYVEVPRKNGKTTLSGGIAIYLTCADGESGAQVVAGATQERQARVPVRPGTPAGAEVTGARAVRDRAVPADPAQGDELLLRGHLLRRRRPARCEPARRDRRRAARPPHPRPGRSLGDRHGVQEPAARRHHHYRRRRSPGHHLRPQTGADREARPQGPGR
jgi:hypothetical protein